VKGSKRLKCVRRKLSRKKIKIFPICYSLHSKKPCTVYCDVTKKHMFSVFACYIVCFLFLAKIRSSLLSTASISVPGGVRARGERREVRGREREREREDRGRGEGEGEMGEDQRPAEEKWRVRGQTGIGRE
jgi:hypothetical protein